MRSETVKAKSQRSKGVEGLGTGGTSNFQVEVARMLRTCCFSVARRELVEAERGRGVRYTLAGARSLPNGDDQLQVFLKRNWLNEFRLPDSPLKALKSLFNTSADSYGRLPAKFIALCERRPKGSKSHPSCRFEVIVPVSTEESSGPVAFQFDSGFILQGDAAIQGHGVVELFNLLSNRPPDKEFRLFEIALCHIHNEIATGTRERLVREPSGMWKIPMA